MNKDYREGELWEKALVYVIAVFTFADVFYWLAGRVGVENLNPPRLLAVVVMSSLCAVWSMLASLVVLSWRHDKRKRSRRR